MNRVFILGGQRSHIGVKNGQFKRILPEILGATVLKQVVETYQLSQINEIIGGNVVGTGGNITRLMALHAGLSENIVAYTVDMQCASASLCIDLAYQKIKSGQCDLVIAGGFESSSLQPQKSYHPHDPRYITGDGTFSVSQFSPHEQGENVMLLGAERVAQAYQISKSELDFWTLESHRRAVRTRNEQLLEGIIVPINRSSKDEGIRDRMSQRIIDRLPSLVCQDGRIHAANACLMNDGAAFVVLCSERYLSQSQLQAKAEILQTTLVGGSPLQSPTLALKAMNQLLKSQRLDYEEISIFEVNEAFGVIDVLFEREHPQLIDRYNPFGGALAYGHPYGASGAIILLHLLKGLEIFDGNYGVSSIAAAGGLGSAMLVRKVKDDELL